MEHSDEDATDNLHPYKLVKLLLIIRKVEVCVLLVHSCFDDVLIPTKHYNCWYRYEEIYTYVDRDNAFSFYIKNLYYSNLKFKSLLLLLLI